MNLTWAGLGSSFSAGPRLAPLRQAQGGLWAAFCRRFAAGVGRFSSLASSVNVCAYPQGLKPDSKTAFDAGLEGLLHHACCSPLELELDAVVRRRSSTVVRALRHD